MVCNILIISSRLIGAKKSTCESTYNEVVFIRKSVVRALKTSVMGKNCQNPGFSLVSKKLEHLHSKIDACNYITRILPL